MLNVKVDPQELQDLVQKYVQKRIIVDQDIINSAANKVVSKHVKTTLKDKMPSDSQILASMEKAIYNELGEAVMNHINTLSVDLIIMQYKKHIETQLHNNQTLKDHIQAYVNSAIEIIFDVKMRERLQEEIDIMVSRSLGNFKALK